MKPWLLMGWLVSVAAAGAIGYAAHKPEPAVDLHQQTASAAASTSAVQVVAKQDPVRIVTRTVTKPGPGCAGAEVEQVVTEDRGQLVTETQGHGEQHATTAARTDLRIDPPRLPGWAIGAGVEDPLGSRRPHLELGRRVLGPVWLRAGVTPARGLAGVYLGLAVEF